MKTITYNEILYRAAETAGRVRTQIPVPEAAMLKSILSMELRRIWQGMDWNELIPDPIEVAVTDGQFSKNEGSTNEAAPEMGDILGVWTGNPRNYSGQYLALAHDEGDGVVRLRPPESGTGDSVSMPETVWVEYQLPCPDLVGVAAADLAEYPLPEKFAPWLAARAAGHLLSADGATSLAGVQFGLAEVYLQEQEARITRPEWRWKLRVTK